MLPSRQSRICFLLLLLRLFCAVVGVASLSSLPADTNQKIRCRGRVAYDGTGFSGWQVQGGGGTQPKQKGAAARTIQGELQSVLSRRFHRPVSIVGAGRTDAGVHARGQAFHFDLTLDEWKDSSFAPQLQTSLNAMLPPTIRLWNLQRAPLPRPTNHRQDASEKHHWQQENDDDDKDKDTELWIPQPPEPSLVNWGDGEEEEAEERQPLAVPRPWHAIVHAQRKLYSYRICTGPALHPLHRFTRTHMADVGAVDIDLLATAMNVFVGTHNFRAFAGAVEANAARRGVPTIDTVRTVYRAHVIREEAHWQNFRLDFVLQGALYKMVRNMVGTAMEVARGRFTLQELEFLVHSGATLTRSDNACKPAPPQGLTLEHVFYDDY